MFFFGALADAHPVPKGIPSRVRPKRKAGLAPAVLGRPSAGNETLPSDVIGPRTAAIKEYEARSA